MICLDNWRDISLYLRNKEKYNVMLTCSSMYHMIHTSLNINEDNGYSGLLKIVTNGNYESVKNVIEAHSRSNFDEINNNCLSKPIGHLRSTCSLCNRYIPKTILGTIAMVATRGKCTRTLDVILNCIPKLSQQLIRGCLVNEELLPVFFKYNPPINYHIIENYLNGNTYNRNILIILLDYGISFADNMSYIKNSDALEVISQHPSYKPRSFNSYELRKIIKYTTLESIKTLFIQKDYEILYTYPDIDNEFYKFILTTIDANVIGKRVNFDLNKLRLLNEHFKINDAFLRHIFRESLEKIKSGCIYNLFDIYRYDTRDEIEDLKKRDIYVNKRLDRIIQCECRHTNECNCTSESNGYLLTEYPNLELVKFMVNTLNFDLRCIPFESMLYYNNQCTIKFFFQHILHHTCHDFEEYIVGLLLKALRKRYFETCKFFIRQMTIKKINPKRDVDMTISSYIKCLRIVSDRIDASCVKDELLSLKYFDI